MSNPRAYGVSVALNRVAEQLLKPDATAHMAVVITIDGVASPEIYIAQSTDAYTEFRDISLRRTGDVIKGAAPWSVADLIDAATYLKNATTWLEINSFQADDDDAAGSYALEQADKSREWLRDQRTADVLQRAAYEAEHQEICGNCRRRFRTKRGLASHRARNRYCKTRYELAATP